MRKQEIIKNYQDKLIIENYSEQTIRNYVSSLKLFLEYISKLNVQEVTDKEIQKYLGLAEITFSASHILGVIYFNV